MEVETQEWIGVASCERPSLKPEAMVMSQSELPREPYPGLWLCSSSSNSWC